MAEDKKKFIFIRDITIAYCLEMLGRVSFDRQRVLNHTNVDERL